MGIGNTHVADLSKNASGTGWSWTAATATLTLEDSYTGQSVNIFCASTDNIQLQYSGNVTALSTSDDGLYCEGNLRIVGNGGKLTITGGLNNSGLAVGGALEITQSAAVAASGGDFNGINAANGLTISGDADVTTVGGRGIVTRDGSVTIDTTGSVSATGKLDGYAIVARIGGNSTSGQLLVKNGTVTLTQADNPANLYSGELIHTGGTVNGVGVATKYAVSVTDGTASPTTAAKDATVTLTASAAPSGQRFKEWTITPAVTFVEGTTKTSATAKFTMPAQVVTAEATYENIPAGTYAVTVTDGTASPSTAAEDATVTLTATAAPSGQRFKEWTITPAVTFVEGTTKTSTTAKFSMPAQAVTAEATYENIQTDTYAVTVTDGTASPTTAAKDATVTLTASAAPSGQRFKEWTITPAVTFVDGTTKTSATAKFTMPAQAVKAVAAFEKIPVATGTMGIGNTHVSDLSKDASGTGWAWTAATATLTLEGSYTGEAISILCATTDNVELLYSGDVTARATDGDGLYCKGNLRIGGIGDKLTISALAVDGALEITQSAAVAASGDLGGIFAKKGLTISGDADVTAVGHIGITTHDGSVTIDTTGSVSATGKLDGYAIVAMIGGDYSRGQLLVKNGTVTLTQADTPANLYTGELIHTGGTVNGVGVGVTTDAATPVITTQPQGATIKVGGAVTLRVAASVSDGGTLSYQWGKSNNSELGGTIIPGAIGATYTPSTAAVGTMYYLCTVTNTNKNASGNKTAMISSEQIAVTVQSGGGGGGSTVIDPPTVVKPDPAKPDTPTTTTTNVKADSKGNAAITDSVLDAAVKKAQDEAKKNGTEKNGIVVEFNITGTAAGSNMNVNLPKSVLDKLEKAGVKSATIKQNGMELTLDLAAIKEIQKANVDAILSVSKQDVKKLSKEAQAAIGSRPVYNISMKTKEGKAITGFGKGQLSVAIPYTPAAGEKQGNLFCVYVDDKGKVEWLTNSSYDAVNKKMIFATNHLSVYGVGYKADTASTKFTDVGGHWAKDDIAFVVSRGLFSGTSTTTFSPNTAMTRGMFVTALGRLASADVSGYTKSSFTDVKSDAYYMRYIEWASKNNIVNGTGDNKFAPDQSITREQMAVIMSNYAKVIGFALPKVHAENIFTDSAKISAYAKDAVKQMQMAGVISGKSGNIFDPQGTATRAEVSAVLRRFVELAISSDTAQGWAMNDSGKWMYYENGNPVTGKKNIDGSTYTFDQYGVMADVPKNLKYTIYTVQKGDSFWRIAHKLSCTMSELERLNNKSRFDLIHPGDVLRVPEK